MDPRWKSEYKENVVYLHVFSRSTAGGVVNISPFAIKFELWLRINEIPFETIDDMGWSKKGQTPFMLWNGKEIPDSNIGIEFLCQHFKMDPYPGLTKQERAIARAFLKMLEENTKWPIFFYRYAEHADEYSDYFMPNGPEDLKKEYQVTLKTNIINRAHAQGMGRHSSEEMHRIGCADIQAISDFLDDKPYMIGEQPTLLDCAVFGMMSQLVYVPIGFPERKHIMDHCPNIVSFMDRLREKYWHNWHEQCQI